jgi:hypothetical protein
MAITYTSVAGNTNIAGHIFGSKLGTDTYTTNRFFTKFDTSTIIPTIDQITAVKLYLKVTANTGTDDYILTSGISTDSNWGAAVVGDEADFISTADVSEGTTSVGSTGWKSWTIDKTHLDLAGYTWFKLKGSTEFEASTKNITFASQGNATPADRPYLEITYSTASSKFMMTSLGRQKSQIIFAAISSI